MLSLKRYGWLCVLGGEIVYIVCLLGGLLPHRSDQATTLHRTLFETMPGFTWLTPGNVILGAIYVFVLSWIFAWYYVWVHNTSIKT